MESQIIKYTNYIKQNFWKSFFFNIHKYVKPKRNRKPKRNKKSRKTVIERHEKVMEKLEIEKIYKMKELKELETTK